MIQMVRFSFMSSHSVCISVFLKGFRYFTDFFWRDNFQYGALEPFSVELRLFMAVNSICGVPVVTSFLLPVGLF